MKLKDYYKTLGLDRYASAADIKEAYHRLMKIYHPDNNAGSKDSLEMFYEVNEAYRVLGDLDNRLQYSIMLNKDMLDRELKHRKFEIPGFDPKKKTRKKKIKIVRRYGRKVL